MYYIQSSMRTYVYICTIYIYMLYIYSSMRTCMCIYTVCARHIQSRMSSMRIYTYVYTYVHTYITYIYIYPHTIYRMRMTHIEQYEQYEDIYMYYTLHIYIHILHTHTHTHAHTYTHTHTHTYIVVEVLHRLPGSNIRVQGLVYIYIYIYIQQQRWYIGFLALTLGFRVKVQGLGIYISIYSSRGVTQASWL